MQKGRDLRTQIYYGESPPFSGLAQVDAAAGVEEDEACCGGGRARAAVGSREEEDDGKGENEERPVVPIYKEKTDKWARKQGGRKLWVSSLSGRLDSRDGY